MNSSDSMPALVFTLDRMEIQRNNPMYPTELCKLIIANADFPAGKSMIHHAFNNAIIEIFNTQVNLSHNVSGCKDINVMPPTSMILSLMECILPNNWGNESIKRMEAHLEVPSLVFHFTKPQLLVMHHLVSSWSATLLQKKDIPVLSTSMINKVFDKDVHSSSSSHLDISITNIDIQYCTTSLVMAAACSMGALRLALTTAKDNDVTTTYLMQGPCDTGTIYSGALFSGGMPKEDQLSIVGPVLSLSFQMTLKSDQQDLKSSISVPQTTKMSNAFLLHVKGIAVCLDPLLYSWLDSQQDITSPSSTNVKSERDRKRRRVSLTRTSSIGTPRKKSFARVCGPTTPQKEKKSPEDKSSSKDADSSFGNQGYTLETWLFDKLPLITTFAVQVDVKSVTLFTPERHIPFDPQAQSIPQNLTLQRLKAKDTTSFPSTLVLCLPSLELNSSHHNKVSFRPKLPVNLQKNSSKDHLKSDTLPWTLNANNMAVYSIHGTEQDSVYYMISPVSCTAVLASAQTSSVTSPVTSSLHHNIPRTHKTGSESHRVPTLGFCVHTDFTPVVVSSSRKQITLLANIMEVFLHTVIPSSSTDLSTSPYTPAKQAHPTLQRTTSMTSSSAVDQAEKEIECQSESSSSFTDVNQLDQGVRLSLWLQWTVPRLVVKLFGHLSKDNIPICVTTDLEDLTAFVDYQDTHLQMQYKVGAFGVTHTVKSDSEWHPGPYGGILFSCKDILSYKTSPLIASPRLPPTGTSSDGPINNPHGFLTITYNCLNLHFKRRHSDRTRSDSIPNECFRLQHEVRVACQPFDVVLWSPVMVAAIDVFDARLLDKFKFLSQGEFSKKLKHTSNTEDTENAVISASLLPLLFVNMREIRLFLPCSNVTSTKGSQTTISQDLIVIHLSKVSTTPHPDNPIARSVLSKDLYEKYVGFGRSSRRALGYDLHEVQYQTDFSGFGIWAAKWSELCGNLSQQGKDILGGDTVMDQNPALEWNTRLWQSAKEVNVSLLLSESDFKIVLAPAVAMEMTLPNSKVTKSLPVCGWSLEMNIVTDVECYLNKMQILLLQLLAKENIEMVCSCELLSSLSHSNPSSSDVRKPIHEGEVTDSGLGSSQPEQAKKHATVPFEAFFAARKLSIKIYTRHTSHRRKSLHSSPLYSREGSPGRFLSLHIKAVLLVDIVEPAAIYKDQGQGPSFQLWCYDAIVIGCEAGKGWLHKSLPEASDFNIKCFSTNPGLPDPSTGVKPSLLTAGIQHGHDKVNTFIEVGRQIQLSFSLDMISELVHLFDDLIVTSTNNDHRDTASVPASVPAGPSTLHHIDIKTQGMSLHVSMTTAHDSCQKLIVAMARNQSDMIIKTSVQGKFPMLTSKLEFEGLEVSFVITGQQYYFIKPFAVTCDAEMGSWQSTLMPLPTSLPPICSNINIGLLQIDFGQQHLQFIAAASTAVQGFLSSVFAENDSMSTSTCDNILQPTLTSMKNDVSLREEACLDFEVVDEEKPLKESKDSSHAAGVVQSCDDLRSGPFKYVTVSGTTGLHHPEPYEILFTSDTRDKPPSMIWRYPEPRALAAVQVLPLPFTSPVLVNTLNMGDELRVPCVLSYWDNLQKCYVVYKEFYISEVSSCNISLPDPLTADPSTVIVSEEWQMIVDASIDVELTDDRSLHDEDGGSSYSSPFRSLISATSLAASVKVNSVYSPSLIPVISAQLSISMVDIKLLSHSVGGTQVLPKYLQNYAIDPSVPTEQEFLHLTVEGLRGVGKYIHGNQPVSLCHVEWNCYCEVLDFDDLTYQCFLDPFDASCGVTLFHGEMEITNSKTSHPHQPVWLQASIAIGDIDSVISQTTVHTIAQAVNSWSRPLDKINESVIFNHYIICNDTNEDIRLGQVDTDEAILLPSRHVLPYSWRISRHVNRQSKMHMCFESEGDWRWSEPFNIDVIGVCTRVIHHKLHSASVVVDVVPLSGVQKQVIFRGGLQITSRLAVKTDLQILKNPSLASISEETSTLQVHEDISLSPHTTLPSYVVSHAGLVGIRVRIPGTSTWSEPLPLDHFINGDNKQQHLIVKLLGVKTFKTFYLWYCLEKTVYDQTQITLSPLFVMRSHLPDPVLMNVFTAKANTTSTLQVHGRGQEEQVLDLEPNSWHHLTFQVNSQGGTSQPSVPLNSTLIDLVNKVSPDEFDDEGTSLETLWPYCVATNRDVKPTTDSSVTPLRHVISSVTNNQSATEQSEECIEKEGIIPFPDIELQCRVIKKWNNLSTLLIDVIPWCLVVNKTMASLYIRDRESNMEIELPASKTIAPYKFKGEVQLGMHVAGSSTLCWSKPITITSKAKPLHDASTFDSKPLTDDDVKHVTISIVYVTKSDQPMGVQLTMTSQLRHGVLIVSFQEKYSIVNSSGRPLFAFTALAAQGKRVPSEALTVAMSVPANTDTKTPVTLWYIPSSSSVVLDKEGVATIDDTLTVVNFTLDQEHIRDNLNTPDGFRWSSAFILDPKVSRHALSVLDGNASIPLVVTYKEVSGVIHIIIAIDPSPRLVIYNDCQFTLQFGQAAPPQSPSHQKGSGERLVVLEQMQPLCDVPEVPALGMMHYELPVMREWFQSVNQTQVIPDVHLQAMYNVTVDEISEDSEAAVTMGQSSEVPQGWTHGLDINKAGHFVVNLPGRGRVIVFVSKSRLCTFVRISPYDEDGAQIVHDVKPNPVSRAFKFVFSVSKLDICLMNTRSSVGNPVEVLRSSLNNITIAHEPISEDAVCEFSLKLNSFQLDNQLEGCEFPVVLITNDEATKSVEKKIFSKPFMLIQVKYEPATGGKPMFIHSVLVGVNPVTVFLEDKLVYDLLNLAESFLPPLKQCSTTKDLSPFETASIMFAANSVLQPLVIGEFTIEPATIHLTLHASIKLFVAMDDTPLNLASYHVRPVFADGSSFARNVFYHYISSVFFKIGWVVGSLDILGSPAGLIRNVSQGFADFFYFPYDGLTRGPSAFVSGMSHGVSSFVRHISTGALTSVTNLASSISRNLEKLSMDEGHIRLQEEQRARRPTRLMTGITHGLGGFGLSLLGAVAGVVDQPIQGIQRANDVKQAAAGVLTGVGKGLVGVVTKPLGGAMELVSQAGQGILRGTGLSHMPSRLRPVEEKIEFVSSNSHLKYSWKMLHFKTNQDLLLTTNVTVVTVSGHEYSGALLLTSSTLYIANSAVDAVQQTLHIQDTDLHKDDNDNRVITVTSVISNSFPDITRDNLPTGDPERLEQFLRDAQAYARVSRPDGSSEDSPGTSIFTSKFSLIVDPILRETILSRFRTLKYNLMVDAIPI